MNYDESKVPKYELPDPLVCFDGRKVSDAAMYGEAASGDPAGLRPARLWSDSEIKTRLRFEAIAQCEGVRWSGDGKQIRIRLLESTTPLIDLLLYVPNNTSGPAPAFLGLNYGNQGVDPDPGIIPSRNAVCQRGEHAQRWPLEMLLKRGYAVACFHGGDIELDRHGSGCRFTTEGWQKGIRHFLLRQSGRTELADNEWGSIGAWAWGLSRALDYLQTDPTIDGSRVAVFGHSRTGKTALWAGAQDERFALVISNNSGQEGPAGPAHAMAKRLPHPIRCRESGIAATIRSTVTTKPPCRLTRSADRPDRSQAVYVASAEKDRWADPRGEFLARHMPSRSRLPDAWG